MAGWLAVPKLRQFVLQDDILQDVQLCNEAIDSTVSRLLVKKQKSSQIILCNIILIFSKTHRLDRMQKFTTGKPNSREIENKTTRKSCATSRTSKTPIKSSWTLKSHNEMKSEHSWRSCKGSCRNSKLVIEDIVTCRTTSTTSRRRQRSCCQL